MKVKFYFLFVIYLCSSATYAGSWTGYGEVDVIYMHGSYEGIFVKRGEVINPDNCPNSDFLFLHNTNKHYKEIYSFLLAANASRRHVRVWVGGCDSENGRPLLKHAMN